MSDKKSQTEENKDQEAAKTEEGADDGAEVKKSDGNGDESSDTQTQAETPEPLTQDEKQDQ